MERNRHLLNPSPLKAERERHGWSQYELAQRLGVGVSTVARWEQGKAVPYPYYRKRLATLFGKTPQQLGLPPDTDDQAQAPSTALRSETTTEARLLTDPVIPQAESPLASHELPKPIMSRLSPRSLWDGSFGSIRAPNPFSWHFLLITTILLAVVIIMADLPVFPRFSWPGMGQKHVSPSSKNARQDIYASASYALKISLKIANSEASSQLAQRLQQVFKAVYPQLVNQFAHDPDSTVSNPVRLILSADLSSPASTSGRTITLNAHWMQEHPSQIGILTHELALVVEAYPAGVPAWFADGMANYARSLYGPADDAWSLPDSLQPHESYRQGGAIAARFLVWLQLHTRLDLLEYLHHVLQRGQSLSAVFHNLTHETVDDLWSLYQAHPDITPTPQQSYTMATNTKPLFQSTWQLKGSDYYAEAEGLFLSNFVMQADITILAGSAGGGGFFFRSDDTSWSVIYLFVTGRYRLDYHDASGYHLGPPTMNSAIKVGLNQTNRLTIIVQKQSISVYINGQFITKVDATHMLNYGMLRAISTQYTDDVFADVQFDHVQVF